jgi:hypothetical protein
VYTYEPGQTITVKFTEYISHPGYFRFAFDNDGDNDFVTPKSIKPPNPPPTPPPAFQSIRQCPLPGGVDQCGQTDFYNSPTVLPNMDNLDWHWAGTNGKVWTYQVKLPDVECTQCTLQLIQVMEDNAAHGPYTPAPGFMGDTSLNDQYFTCIDIILKRNGSAGTGGASGSGGATGTGGLTGMGGMLPGAGGVITTSGGAGGMTTSAGGIPAGMGGTVPGGGGAVAGVGGATTGPGGTPGGLAGAPAGTGAFFGTGGVDGAPTDDEEGGCAVAQRRSSAAGWLAAAAALALAWTARQRRRRAV